jgi:AcrR family transcriptional regulator
MRLRRGRPCLIEEPERRQLVIDAAESVFLELGYSAAGVTDIARKAGMSKKTIYRLFESKESLFAAVVAARREAIAIGVIEDATDLNSAEKILCHYLGVFARFILAPRQAAIFRLVIAEAHRAPELSRAFYQEGPAKARMPLVQWLERQHTRGVLCVENPLAAASMLLSMVTADLHMRLLIGDAGTIDSPTIDRRVRHAVALFLHGTRLPCMENKMAGQERG